MFQREVASRIKAQPGGRGFGRLAAMSQAFWRVRSLGKVPPGAFRPEPRVWSEVLVFDTHVADPPSDFDTYESLVAAIFAHPRRTIENSLALSWGWDKTRIRDILAKTGIDPRFRPSNLKIEQILKLHKLLH